MITKENLINLCRQGDKEILKTSEILLAGLDKHDLPKLVEERYLTRIKRGYYSLSEELLTEYINLLWSYNLKSDATKYLEKLYSHNKDNRSIVLKLLEANIEIGNLTNIIKYYKELVRLSRDEKEIADAKLYLKIMSYYLPLPEYLKEEADSINPKNTFIKGENGEIQNPLRNTLASGSYIAKEDLEIINDEVVNALLNAKNYGRIFINRAVINALENKDYYAINDLYNLLQNSRNIDNAEQIILLMAGKLLTLKKHPIASSEPHNSTLYSCLMSNNFAYALNFTIDNSILESMIKEAIMLSREWKNHSNTEEFISDFDEYKEELLKEKGAVILEYLTKSEKKQLDLLLSKEENLTAFNITDFGREITVLAYVDEKNKNTYDNLLNERAILTGDKDYEKYLEACLTSLSYDPKNTMTYLRIASTYEVLEDDEKAYKYYTICYGIATDEEKEKFSIGKLKRVVRKRLAGKSKQKIKVLKLQSKGNS